MSQTYEPNIYQSDHAAQTDLGNIEANFATLRSSFSGASAPSGPVPFQLFGDTTDETLQFRNADDNAWFGLMHGDNAQKIYVYRNDAMEGMAIDSSVSDKVLAVKGGATYTTGGATAGTWTSPWSSHNHKWNEQNQPSQDTTWDEDGDAIDVGGETWGTGYAMWCDSDAPSAQYPALNDAWTDNDSTSAGNYRPAAAVGTLQYLDI